MPQVLELKLQRRGWREACVRSAQSTGCSVLGTSVQAAFNTKCGRGQCPYFAWLLRPSYQPKCWNHALPAGVSTQPHVCSCGVPRWLSDGPLREYRPYISMTATRCLGVSCLSCTQSAPDPSPSLKSHVAAFIEYAEQPIQRPSPCHTVPPLRP